MAESIEEWLTEPKEAELVRRLLALARDEELATGAAGRDVTTEACVDEAATGEAALNARAGGVVAGLAVAPLVLQAFAPDVVLNAGAADGDAMSPGQPLATLAGPLRQILFAERTLLNIVGRSCGIASLTRRYVDAVAGTHARICDTRKTTPGLRLIEKHAVRCGGGTSHRTGLADAMLVKDNHIAHVPADSLAAFLKEAVRRARSYGPLKFVEVEVDTLDQLQRLLDAGGCGIDIVLLDNMNTDELRRAVRMRDESGLKIELEASGGVNLQTVGAIAQTGVDRISVGALTHSAVSLDVGLDIARR